MSNEHTPDEKESDSAQVEPDGAGLNPADDPDATEGAGPTAADGASTELAGKQPGEAAEKNPGAAAAGKNDEENHKERAPAAKAEEKPEKQEPQSLKLVGVKFKRAGNTYYFNAGNLLYNIGEYVIVETDRGLGLARVATPIFEPDQDQAPKDIKRIIRKANWNDMERDRKNREREAEAQKLCEKKIESRGINMSLVRVEYLHDASKAIFYFTAEQRVDFRELVKDLARELHTRIEMRQIGVRDETKLVGGLGPCGREVCCTTFLTEFSPVSVRMAKDQNLAMNPSKVSGLCGRLMCCLAFEHETYKELGKGLPKKGKFLECAEGPCKVIDLNILQRKALVELESGKTSFVPVEELRKPGEEPYESPDTEEDEETMDRDMLESDDPEVLERISEGEKKNKVLDGKHHNSNGLPPHEHDQQKPQDRKKHRGRKRKHKEKQTGLKPPKESRPYTPAPEKNDRQPSAEGQEKKQQPRGKRRGRRRRKKKNN